MYSVQQGFVYPDTKHLENVLYTVSLCWFLENSIQLAFVDI